MTSKLKDQALWSVVLQFSRFGGNAVIFLAMARFLTLEQIGAFGMAYAPIRWTQVLFKTGITSSVVVTLREKKDGKQAADSPDFTALFWLAVGVTVLVLLGIVTLAWVLGAAQETNQPVSQMMLAMLAVPVAFGLSSVPEGLLRKNLKIKALALRTITVQALSAVLAVMLAVWGFGAWSLVGFAVLNALLSSAISISMAGWRPSGGADLALICAQIGQFSAISGRSLVAGSVYAMLQFSIGLVLGLGAAGTFQIAQRVYQILDALCLAPIRFLILPLFSREAENNGGMLAGSTVTQALGISAAISAPIYLSAVVLSGPLLSLVIGAENGAQSTPTLQLLCFLGLSICSVTILTQALTVMDRAGLAFVRTVWTLAATAALSLPMLLVSVEAVTLGFVVASYIVLGFFFGQLHPIFGLSAWGAFAASARPYLAGALAFLPLWAVLNLLVNIIGWPVSAVLAAYVPLALGLYFVLLTQIAPETFASLTRLAKRSV